MGAPETAQFQPMKLTLALDEAHRQHLEASQVIVADAEALVVDSAEMAQYANGMLRDIKGRKTRIETMHEDIVGPIRTALANARKWFTPSIEAHEKAETIVKGKISEFSRKEAERIALEDRRRRDAERQAREQAERDAAAAKARAEEAARKSREEARIAEEERKRQEEAARLARESGDKRAAADAERKAQAAAAENARKEEEARQRTETADNEANRIRLEAETRATANAPTVSTATKIDGFGERKNWLAEFAPDTTEEQALEKVICSIAGVEKLAGRRDLLSIVALNMKKAKELAKAQEKNFNVPGLQAVNRPIPVSRG